MSWLLQEAIPITILLIACLHEELQPWKSEIFHFFGHKRDSGMGLQQVPTTLVDRSLMNGLLGMNKDY